MDFVKSFFDQYGISFIMMVVLGFVIAFVTEIAIKKTFDWLTKKLGNKAWLPVAKAAFIQVFAITQTVIYTRLLISVLPLPGGIVLCPVWICLVYLIQYAWSLLGFGRFIEWLKARAEKKAAIKAYEEATRPVLTPIAGHKDIYKNADGIIVDKNGMPV